MLECKEIKEIIRPIESGITEPFLCVADDDRKYCVKGKGILTKGKIAEVISAIAGREIGLPVPDFCVTKFSEGLSGLSDSISGVKSIGLDPAFSSRWIEPTDNFSFSVVSESHFNKLAKIFLFDQWILNGDRTLTAHGGNVNLLFDLTNSSIIVIDHNLAFFGISPEEVRLHVGYRSWLKAKHQKEFLEEVRSAMSDAYGKLRACRDFLPSEWLAEEDEFVDSALGVLARIEGREFWESLP